MKQVEIEERYVIADPEVFRVRLGEMGAVVGKETRVVDHWFIPTNLKNDKEQDEWFNKERGCAIRIREQSGVVTLETKRLTEELNHNTLLEAGVGIESLEKAKLVLEMMGRREFLTIDKQRVMYDLPGFSIAIDVIKDFKAGIEIEIVGGESREQALKAIADLAGALGLREADKAERSLTVMAMKGLAKYV